MQAFDSSRLAIGEDSWEEAGDVLLPQNYTTVWDGLPPQNYAAVAGGAGVL